MNKPLCIDLFCGLGGWSEGFLAEGYECIGFDIERHDYGSGGYPGQLVLQDVLTLHGSQFRNAAVIVASPPCQEFSYMGMPWSRAKQIARALEGKADFPTGYTGSRTREQLTALFDACFRIQREASEAAGRYIPLVVENVNKAQRWVGRAAWHFGSYYLWGDVPALMPHTLKAMKMNPDGTNHGQGSWFAIADSKCRGSRGTNGKNGEGPKPLKSELESAVECENQAETAQETGRKVAGMNFHDHEKGLPGRSFQTAAVEKGFARAWRESPNGMPMMSSHSHARKAASAQIAKIPLALSSHIAAVYHP